VLEGEERCAVLKGARYNGAPVFEEVMLYECCAEDTFYEKSLRLSVVTLYLNLELVISIDTSH